MNKSKLPSLEYTHQANLVSFTYRLCNWYGLLSCGIDEETHSQFACEKEKQIVPKAQPTDTSRHEAKFYKEKAEILKVLII